MANQEPADSLWTDDVPDELIPDTRVPSRAADLERLATKWLEANARFFDPFDWTGMQERYWKRKAFDEAGAYMFHALSFGADEAAPALKERMIDRVNDPRYIQLLQRSETDFHHFTYPLLYVDGIDALDPEIAQEFESIAARGEFWSSERYPYRLLEFCLLSEKVGVESPHDKEAIVEYTSLNHPPSIINSDYLDAYALTHDVMFYTDHYSAEVPRVSYDLASELRGLLLRYLAEDNCDIALELLYAGILLRQVSKELARLVLSWTFEKVDPGGYVPGPDQEGMSAMISPKLKGTDQRAEEHLAPWDYDYASSQEGTWAKNYHTNIVAGMTARTLYRDWDALESRATAIDWEDDQTRRDILRLGELVKSFAQYDLLQGARQMIELAGSPVTRAFPFVFRQTIDFLEKQKTQTGEFGHWTDEEILYTNSGNSRESFTTELVEPVSDVCQKALDAVEKTHHR